MSCLLHTYNYGHYLERAIESVLAQDYPPDALEIILTDDGSTDGTEDVVAPYLDRVQYCWHENAGLIGAVNRSLARATGEFITFLSVDDYWRPEKVRRQVELLLARPEVGLVYSDMEVVDDHGRSAGRFFPAARTNPARGRVLGRLIGGNFISGASIMFRTSLRERYHPIPSVAPWEDWWIAVKVAEVAEVDYVEDPISCYRRHAGNMNFGAEGERLARVLRKELPFRRWLLAGVEPGAVGGGDLLAALANLDMYADMVVRAEGVPRSQVLPVTARQRMAAERWLERAVRALYAEEPASGLEALVRALAEDPGHERAREWLAACTAARDGAGAGASGGAAADEPRGFVTLALADDLLDDPGLLRAYGRAFSDADEATLVVYAPGWTTEQTLEVLGRMVRDLGVGAQAGADVLARPMPPSAPAEYMLAREARALLSPSARDGAFARLPWFDARRVDGLRALYLGAAAPEGAIA